MRKLVIDTQGVRSNLAAIKAQAGKGVIYAVLTGDAHGAGLVPMAQLLADEGITRFAISEPEEAAALRKAGLVDAEILMLRSTHNVEELEALMDLNVVCTVGTVEAGVVLNRLAESRSTIAEAHLQVDSGMGYGGFLAEEPDKIISAYQNFPSVAFSGIYTQMQTKGSRGRGLATQLESFHQVVSAIQAAGFETGVVHAASSYAALHYDFARLDGVRIGSALLGRCRRTVGDGLQRVGFGEATVGEIRWLPKDHTVGYETPVHLKKPTRVATLTAGYQNGFGLAGPREWGLRAALRRFFGRDQRWVRVNGQKARVIGPIGSLDALVDVTNLKCTVGDVAQFEVNPLFASGMKKEYRP